MGRWLISPRWIGLHLIVLAAMVTCGLLGWWQLDRANQVHEATLAPARNAALSPVPIADVLTQGTLSRDDAIGRRVSVTGEYDAAAQLLVPGRTAEGTDGVAVLTPLVLANGTAVIVERGVVPAGSPTTVPPAASGEVTVVGWVATSEAAPDKNIDLPAGEIGSVHLPSLANLVPYPLFDTYLGMVSQSPAPTTTLAQEPGPEFSGGGQWPLQNLFYALEWWVFGLAALAFWIASVRRGPAPTPSTT